MIKTFKNGLQPDFIESRVDGWETQSLLKTSMWRIGKTWEKLGAKNWWTWCGKILSWTERSMVAGSWSTGQVNLVSKCRQHTSSSLKGKRKKILVTIIQQRVQLFAFNHLVNSFLFEHFNSPFSGTKSEVSVTRTKFTGNCLEVKI